MKLTADYDSLKDFPSGWKVLQSPAIEGMKNEEYNFMAQADDVHLEAWAGGNPRSQNFQKIETLLLRAPNSGSPRELMYWFTQEEYPTPKAMFDDAYEQLTRLIRNAEQFKPLFDSLLDWTT